MVTLQIDGGPSRQLPERYVAEHLEHGYALTGHAAQGASVDRAFVLVRAEGALAEWGYVAASRARAETRLYAVGPEVSTDAGLARSEPVPATPFVAAVLARHAAEPTALAQAERQRRAPSSIQLVRQRLERQIAMRQELLDSASKRLERLGWVGSRRQGPALRQTIEAQRRVLDDLQTRLRELPGREVRARPVAPEREPFSKRLERTVQHPRQRGMGLHL